jgi:hypothetical protein
MSTLVIRVPLVDTSIPPIPLEKRISDLCAVEDAVGYRLVGFTAIVGNDLLFIFQKET